MIYIGFERVASSAAVRTVHNLTIPRGATHAEIQADTQNVRYTMDAATNPAEGSGMMFLTTSEPKTFLITNVRRIRFIQDTAGAGALNIHYFAGREIS